MRAAIAAMAMMAMACIAGGCRCGQRNPSVLPPIQRGEAPTYSQVVEKYNVRVEPLKRLWARTVVRLKFINAEGKEQREQVEGFCQFVPPSKALVTFHKVSQVLALLGSDGERYWWIEMGDVKRAVVGRHDQVTPERIAKAGLRVHPLDLMDLLGLTPLPSDPSGGGSATWSADGRAIIVTVPARLGTRRMSIDPDTYEARRVEIMSASGEVLAASDLANYQRVAIKGAGPDVPHPYIPTRVDVEADRGATSIIMDLSEPQDDPARFRPITFDFDRLLEVYEVTDVRDLDRN